MEHVVSLRFMIILLVFSIVLSNTFAVPWSRSLKAVEGSLLAHDFQDQMAGVQVVEEKKDESRRMDVEISDYAGTGANNHHDPKPPGPGTD